MTTLTQPLIEPAQGVPGNLEAAVIHRPLSQNQERLVLTEEGDARRLAFGQPDLELNRKQVADLLGDWFGGAEGLNGVIHSKRLDLVSIGVTWLTAIEHPTEDERILICPVGATLHTRSTGEFITTLSEGDVALRLCEWFAGQEG